jgi:hypothetical protein
MLSEIGEFIRVRMREMGETDRVERVVCLIRDALRPLADLVPVIRILWFPGLLAK